MTQTTSKDDIERCRNVSIHELFGLQNKGRRVMVKCPFHDDKTASCAMYPNNGFHCFGCGAHGNNAIDFVMKLYEDEEPDKKKRFSLALEELKKHI